jgi:enoyl-CoA hydratase/carnithine racemase
MQATANGGSTTEIIRKRQGSVEWFIFNRPHVRNAETEWMDEELVRVCTNVNADPTVKALVFTGVASETPCFTSGADFSRLRSVNSMADIRKLEDSGERLSSAIESVRVPTIAAMAGPAIGGGVLIAASCDIRIASPSLRFGFPLARSSGSCLSMRNLARLSNLIGYQHTKELVMSARLLNANELAEAGALNEIVPDEPALFTRAQQIAESYADLAPLTIWATKEAMRRLRDFAIPPHADADILAACYLSQDFREGIAAFREKRKPRWRGC